MVILITAVLSGFFGAAFGLLLKILYDRSQRPAPNYDFEFKKEVSYQDAVNAFGTIMPTSGHFPNYIRIENYGDDSLFNVSTKVWFDTRKERRYYQTMGIKENLFDWRAEHLSAFSRFSALHDISFMKSRKEVFQEKIKRGFFIPNAAMEKLKNLSPIKVKVEYDWNNKNYSDIWLFDFSDENEVLFYLPRLTLWQKIKLVLKRAF